MPSEDIKFMRLALRLAEKGRGLTNPNPMVGAVVVKDGEIVGRGYHHQAGQAHAEILALREAGARARGATLYLNLEPCAHFGRTPPCTEAILKAGIKRVVAGMIDPNPLVSGRGIARLRAAGVKVEAGLLAEECRQLNAPFVKYITTGKPLITLKVALSMDGKVATNLGEARWISSAESRAYVHRIRHNADAVMVGIGTVLQDDPLLTVRLPALKNPRQPLRVVVDSRLRIPLKSQIVKTAKYYPTLVATTNSAPLSRIKKLAKAKVEVLTISKDRQGKVNLIALMEELAKRGILSVLLEGGPTLNASALQGKLVDRLLFFIAPKLIGGEKAPGAIGGKGIKRLKDAIPVKNLRVRKLGSDLVLEGEIGADE
ncbi:MAG: bifunctional diaminohydroxyphosphoribosylaminopyrimidine deaminase/5-amino-6-(5-phosphoribosylamino)uracil reductase RibD [Thermodesulfobacteriota bacterium]